MRSAAEVAAYMARLGVSAAAAAEAIAQGRQQGWIDDRACGQLWASHWARQGYAQAAIVARLRAKGLSDTVVRQSLAKAAVPSDREGARAQVAHAGAKRTPAQWWGRLRRRGFDDDAIDDALRHAE